MFEFSQYKNSITGTKNIKINKGLDIKSIVKGCFMSYYIIQVTKNLKILFMIYVNRCKERSQDNMGHTTDVRAQVFSKTQRDLAYDYGQGNSIKNTDHVWFVHAA